ncbi:MAG: hypothetical protein ACYCZ0_05120 [Minisyncoccota bacterium]
MRQVLRNWWRCRVYRAWPFVYYSKQYLDQMDLLDFISSGPDRQRTEVEVMVYLKSIGAD